MRATGGGAQVLGIKALGTISAGAKIPSRRPRQKCRRAAGVRRRWRS
jgi:hypothetical protein